MFWRYYTNRSSRNVSKFILSTKLIIRIRCSTSNNNFFFKSQIFCANNINNIRRHQLDVKFIFSSTYPITKLLFF